MGQNTKSALCVCVQTVTEYIYLSTVLQYNFEEICTLLEYHFWGDFTQVHLRRKYCILYSTTFLSIIMSTRYYF